MTTVTLDDAQLEHVRRETMKSAAQDLRILAGGGDVDFDAQEIAAWRHIAEASRHALAMLHPLHPGRESLVRAMIASHEAAELSTVRAVS